MTRHAISLGVLGLAAVGLLACSTSSWTTREVVPSEGETANVFLYLSNQSSVRSIPLSVYVDGQRAVHKTMSPAMTSRTHGFPETVPLRLPPGPHTIRVVAEGANAAAAADVVVGDSPVHVDAAYTFTPSGHGPGGVSSIEIHVGSDRPGFC